MPVSLNELLQGFEEDSWRREVGFSPEVEAANERLFASTTDVEKQREAINEWMRKYQPCLFGRAAATQNAIEYCILNEADLNRGDEFIQRQISRDHLRWTQATIEGRSSNFILLLVSKRITLARPDYTVMEFAKRLAQLYLNEERIEPDQIYHDAAYLAVPDYREHQLRWKAGVNYFSTHGDKRWWQDHRIPGGLGFSTNSVGHLAKSGKLLGLLTDTARELGLPDEKRAGSRIDSLGRALQVAMQTINNASEGISGKATELVPLPGDPTNLPVKRCPVELGAALEGKNFCWYKGYYHTDHTLPRVYFRPDVDRPADVEPIEPLDFTYLFDDSVDNAAFRAMGAGVPIRDDEVEPRHAPRYKRDRVTPEKILISSDSRLAAALKAR
jgi:hypothetical protein